jgi:hypothetical protein
VRGSGPAHDAIGRQLLQAAERQHAIQVLLGEARVDVQVIDADVIFNGAQWSRPPALIAPP